MIDLLFAPGDTRLINGDETGRQKMKTSEKQLAAKQAKPGRAMKKSRAKWDSIDRVYRVLTPDGKCFAFEPSPYVRMRHPSAQFAKAIAATVDARLRDDAERFTDSRYVRVGPCES